MIKALRRSNAPGTGILFMLDDCESRRSMDDIGGKEKEFFSGRKTLQFLMLFDV